jgi:hypothetical protein
MRPLSWLEPLLSTEDPAATITRVFQSKHVADLRYIVSAAIVALIVVAIVALLGIIEAQVVNHWHEIHESHGPWGWIRLLLAAFGSFLTFFLPILAALGALVAWAYQAASKRLGVVDLFACEISTICRIAAVLDSVHTIVERFELGPAALPSESRGQQDDRPFLSQENYFPVFDGNSSDLQALEANVVINITGFYTYMKGLRDSLRLLTGIKPKPADYALGAASPVATGPWHEAARNVVYLWLLGLESARHAVRDLVEFEPDQAERIIMILLGELEAYRFLRSQFTDPRDVHTGRIEFREQEYEREVSNLRELVKSKCKEKGGGQNWRPAEILLPELDRRFQAALRVGPRPLLPVAQPQSARLGSQAPELLAAALESHRSEATH